jgi:hypothetical protein
VPLNGSGGVTQPTGSIYPATANTLIESAKANTSIADIYSILGSAIYKDGQQVTTARIPFASGIQTDTVTEKTSDTGVTLDSVLLKDGRVDTTQGADIASAATVNLETATGNVVDVTGTTTITAITLSQGHWRVVRFTGALTLTNGASLVLPGAANITTAAGDYALFVGYAASVVRVAGYWPATGAQPFLDSNPVVIGATDQTKKIRFEVDGLTTATTRVLTVQDSNHTLVGRDTTDTLTNKTLTSPTLTAPALNGALTGDAIAAQAEMETGTATDSIVTPGRQHFHPGHPKFWLNCDAAGNINASYNITSITDTGPGDLAVVIATDFSSVDYAIVSGVEGGALHIGVTSTSQAAGSFSLEVRDTAGTLTDPTSYYVIGCGDQA